MNYVKYLNRKHDYSTNNCITLINEIYKNDLSSDIFDSFWEYASIPEGKITDGRAWMRRITVETIENWASTVAKKVNLTEAQEYDVIVFKSKRALPIHFGMYIGKNRFIHLEEGRYSKIDVLNDDWREFIGSIWRQTGKNM
jgi:hypothetical protein